MCLATRLANFISVPSPDVNGSPPSTLNVPSPIPQQKVRMGLPRILADRAATSDESTPPDRRNAKGLSALSLRRTEFRTDD